MLIVVIANRLMTSNQEIVSHRVGSNPTTPGRGMFQVGLEPLADHWVSTSASALVRYPSRNDAKCIVKYLLNNE